MISLALDMLARPSRAIKRMQENKVSALKSALGIYVVYLAAAVLFYWLKPADFPPLSPDSVSWEPSGGLLFWIKVQAWGPLLTLLWIVLAAWFARLLQGGRLVLRIFGAGLVSALPLLLTLLDYNSSLSHLQLALAWIILLACMTPALAKITKNAWLPLSSFFLAINAVELAFFPLMGMAIALRAAFLYNVLEVALLFWTLGLASYGVSRIMRIQTARAFCAIFLVVVWQVLLVYSFYRIGLLPKGIFKALMTV